MWCERHFRLTDNMKLKLTVQAILLVAIFVICEVALLLTLGWILHDTKIHYSQMQRSRTIVNNVNDLIMFSYNSILALAQTFQDDKPDFEACDISINEIMIRVRRLENLTSDDSQERKIVAKTKEQMSKIALLLDETKRVLKDSEGYSETVVALKLMGKVRGLVNQIVVDITELSVLERKKQKISKSLEKEKANRELLEKIVVIGVLFNIILAIQITVIMTQKFSGRMSVLSENTRRLSRNEELLDPIGGDDEIGDLDKSFHNMANQLSEAREREKEEEERLRSFIHNMLVGLLVIDDKGEIVQSNPYIEDLFGYSSDELRGQRIASLFCDSMSMSLDAFLELLTTKAMGKQAQIQAVNSDGKTFPVEVKLNLLQRAGGTNMVLNVVDLSDKFEVERLKSEMVSMVSHDLKTPLSSIQAAIALVSHGKVGEVSDEAKRLLSKSDREIDRLIKLIGDLLDISKMESGKLELAFEPVALLQVVDRSVGAVEGFRAERELDVTFENPDLEIQADADRLVQVIVNLLSNAIKFSPDKSTIKLHVKDDGKDKVEISVADQGPGISSDFKEKLFTRFERDDDESKAAIEGTGIGLAICKAIVEGHGGEIGVRDNQGAGCTFWVTLPKGRSSSVS